MGTSSGLSEIIRIFASTWASLAIAIQLMQSNYALYDSGRPVTYRSLMADRFEHLAVRAAAVFLPSAPINRAELFAGRIEQIQAVMDAVQTQGQHVALYGERGVGKTSLVSVLREIMTAHGPGAQPVVRENCHAEDTYGQLWLRALESIKISVESPGTGFGADTKKTVVTLAGAFREPPAVHQVVRQLRPVNTPLTFVFDEFDQVADPKVTDAVAETIKALSDYSVPVTIVVVGVGDSVDALIRSHSSIERALVQIRMPRMRQDELAQIVSKAMNELDMQCEAAARTRIVALAQGLPHYVHLLGLHATRHALEVRRLEVRVADVEEGIRRAVAQASQSVLDSYVRAVRSNRKEALFAKVLLACALAETDELGFFKPSSVREPLARMGTPMEIPAFASHLNKFSSDDRGNVLKKAGQQRRYRYRFRNPLLQPFVVMHGLSSGLVTTDVVDELLSTARIGQRTIFGLDGMMG